MDSPEFPLQVIFAFKGFCIRKLKTPAVQRRQRRSCKTLWILPQALEGADFLIKILFPVKNINPINICDSLF